MRIDDIIFETIAFLYPSLEAAQKGEQSGGSGFVLGVPSIDSPQSSYPFLVTNAHVAQKCVAIRMNNKEGGKVIIAEINSNYWINHNNSDIAMLPLYNPIVTATEQHPWSYKSIRLKNLITKELIAEKHIGHGDKVYMVGRFSLHSGKSRNVHSVRFGNISMMPEEPILSPIHGELVEAFIVEMRSRNGYSGSPVFVCGESFDRRPPNWDKISSDSYFSYLLGIDFGHFDSFQQVVNSVSRKAIESPHVVNVSSGMALVAPSWKIIELSEMDKVKEHIKYLDKNKMSKTLTEGNT